MDRLLQQLSAGKILLADGAMGTALQKLGLEPGTCPESWNQTHPQQVESVVAGYVKAGSNLVETNSFGGTRYKLEKFNLANQTVHLNRLAAEIARRAAGKDRFVVGSVGPTGEFLQPLGPASPDEMYAAFQEQIVALADGGADAVCIETMSALDEAKLALQAAKDHTSLTTIVTFTFEKNTKGQYRTMMGVSPEQLAAELPQAGADIIGSNCGTGIEQLVEICRQLRANTDCPLMIQPNAGVPVLQNGQTVFKATPQQMADRVADLIDAGANIIGGCCGTTSEHLAAMKAALQAVHE